MRKLRIVATLSLLLLMGAAAYILIPAKDSFSLKDLVPMAQKVIAGARVPAEVSSTLDNIATQAKTLQGHVSNVLGATNREQPNQPIQERAFEYGRYLYCNQVVDEDRKSVV